MSLKVFHIESGLGNQMLDYADLLASKSVNPGCDMRVETMVYDIPGACATINQWNGYELGSVFGIDAPNVRGLFSDGEWEKVVARVEASAFWERNWCYSAPVVDAFASFGVRLVDRNPRSDVSGRPSQTSWAKYRGRSLYYRLLPAKAASDAAGQEVVFAESDEDEYTGHFLRLQYKGSGVERIDADIREAFAFRSIDDERNGAFARYLDGCEAVAIHARRGDMLGRNGYCYKYGYFKRAVRFMRRRLGCPLFVFFCDPGSVAWCKENLATFGLDGYPAGLVEFVDWNKGADSFRDMQLMADHCRHVIATNSSFGWWAGYLNRNPDKITCSPDPRIVATNSF